MAVMRHQLIFLIIVAILNGAQERTNLVHCHAKAVR